MKYFSLIDTNKSLHPADENRIIPSEEFSTLLDASQLAETLKEDFENEKQKLFDEGISLHEKSKTAGFQEGLEQWAKQLAHLEEECISIQDKTTKTLVPLALTAVKKLIGKELEVNPKIVVDIVSTALKPVSQHRKITIYVNKAELETLEENRAQIKKVFEHLESLSIATRDDVELGGCIIETEAGIINAQLDNQFQALENAFKAFFEKNQEPS